MPYQTLQTPEDPVYAEVRLCLWAAAGCSLVGGAALAYGWYRGERVPLMALLPVAGLYLAMAGERLFKKWRSSRGAAKLEKPGGAGPGGH
jgi:hypothetical protein